MQVAQLNVPAYDNDGVMIPHVAEEAKRMLCRTFGGFTALPAQGGWLDLDTGKVQMEPMHVLQVSMDVSSTNEDTLRDIARMVAREANQKVVYVVHANGHTELVSQGV